MWPKIQDCFRGWASSVPLPEETEKQTTADPSKGVEPEETNIPELESLGFKMVIPDDRLSATIIPPESVPDSITLEALKEHISQKGIVYGLIGDDDLSQLLTSLEPKEGGWLVAEGTPAQAGKTRKLSITLIWKPIRSGPFEKAELLTSRIKEKSSKSRKGTCWPKKSLWSKKSPGRTSLGKSSRWTRHRIGCCWPGKTPRLQKMEEDHRQDRWAAGPDQGWPDLGLSGTENRGGRGLGDRPHPV